MRQGPGYAAMLSIAIGLTACATIQSAQQQDALTYAGFTRVDMSAPQFAAIAPPLPAHRFPVARRTAPKWCSSLIRLSASAHTPDRRRPMRPTSNNGATYTI